jgi:DnaJ-class molecular chaperone
VATSGCTDAEQQFKNVQEAYTVLSDARKRHQYDSGADLEDDMDFDGFGGGGAYIVWSYMLCDSPSLDRGDAWSENADSGDMKCL